MLSKFSNIKEQHFNVTNLKMVYSFLGESIVFQTKLTLRKVSELFISPRPVYNKFRSEDIFLKAYFTYCLHISKPLNTKAIEPLSRQGEPCFLNSEMPKKIHARQSTNKSTVRHSQSRTLLQPAADSVVPPLLPERLK